MYTGKGVELAFHNVEVVHVEPIDFGHGLHLVNVADGSNDVVFVGGEEIFDGLATKSGGAAGDDY